MKRFFDIAPGGSLSGRLHVPGDKSVSHRAVMLGCIARGTTHIDDILAGEDVLATIAAFKKMGVNIEGPQEQLTIHGVGPDGLTAPATPLDLGNSGTAMRLLTGLLSGLKIEATLIGDESLSHRPMNRVVDPLRQMGADIGISDNGYPPVVLGSRELTGVSYFTPVASAQVKSAVLLAGIGAVGETRVREISPTRDHTERMLRTFGASLVMAGEWIVVTGGHVLRGSDVTVPRDLSSAAFFLVAALIAEGSDVVLPGVGVNPTRGGVIRILKAMGADIEIASLRHYGDEPVADIRVRSSKLRAIDVPPELVPLAIDEFPVLAVAAACAQGTTTIRGAEELRVKESDRIATVVAALRAIGVEVEEQPDGMTIVGGAIEGGEVDAAGDHRLAMAFSVAGLVSKSGVRVHDVKNVATSFPDFERIATEAGLRLSASEIATT